MLMLSAGLKLVLSASTSSSQTGQGGVIASNSMNQKRLLTLLLQAHPELRQRFLQIT
jgi:hypothetical protein